ncbi:hypothetical protein G7K_5669-t1 [Saitoella complicata NRRL Y-17804]|uniref:Ribosomal protein S16 n=1 Tax=Saitoella complicata (strain BCRC 22490 / CBS 7301 / JCM 7358 / NBRC 10748 / NRRL Y-17804) TaxID=698492 RepID=A0A0E9NQ70_SAICN|nr:hypothetical protein G7K_5669-t1 [Saitoella complicata NRRL Y-17804]
MQVRIRLARYGVKGKPFYHIVVANRKTGRQTKPIETLGTYDPIGSPEEAGGPLIKEIKFDMMRAKYWLGVGASPSDRVEHLFVKAGLLPVPEKTWKGGAGEGGGGEEGEEGVRGGEGSAEGAEAAGLEGARAAMEAEKLKEQEAAESAAVALQDLPYSATKKRENLRFEGQDRIAGSLEVA